MVTEKFAELPLVNAILLDEMLQAPCSGTLLQARDAVPEKPVAALMASR